MPEVYTLETGILVSEYPLHASIHREDLEEELQKRLRLCKSPHCLLVKLRGLYVLSDDAKEFAASDEELKATLAVAIVFEQGTGYRKFGKILIEDFLMQRKVKYPVELFDREADAVAWLEQSLLQYA